LTDIPPQQKHGEEDTTNKRNDGTKMNFFKGPTKPGGMEKIQR
jgi:hypothetical protein